MKTIFTAGVIAGILDLALAIAFFTLRGFPVDAVPHAIASGLLGVRAVRGGIATAVLGVAIHFCIAITVAAVYYAVSRAVAFANRHPVLMGTAYGLGVFAFMQYVVLPLSAEPHYGHTTAWLVANVVSHIFFIGITIALITSRFAKRMAQGQTEEPVRS